MSRFFEQVVDQEQMGNDPKGSTRDLAIAVGLLSLSSLCPSRVVCLGYGIESVLVQLSILDLWDPSD